MRVGSGSLAPPLMNIPGDAGKHPVQKVSNSMTLPSPIGGINARDSIANMDPTDALDLQNFFPSTLGCVVRNGYVVHSTGYGATHPVCTMADHNRADGTDHLYAFAGGSMYDATGGGAVGAALVSGLTNDHWQWVNFGTTTGVFWIGVNGVDNPIIIDPAGAVHRLVAGDGTTAYTISGVNPATFISVTAHQHRLWFVQASAVASTQGWYLPPSQMWGIANPYPFGTLLTKGGYLMTQITWTVDAGNGPQDQLVTISSAGEVVIYQGTDPSSISTWGLTGVFFLGRPIGVRCAVKFGGDVAILCDQGLASLNSSLTSTTINTRVTFFTDKIQKLISDEINLFSGDQNWQPFVYPQANMLIINVPNPNYPPATSYQLVMNTITGAWTRFMGMSAKNWCNYGKDIYYGGSDGIVYQGLTGFRDAVNPFSSPAFAGNDVLCRVICAFTYFSNPGAEKNFTMIRPNLTGVNKPTYRVISNMQFDTNYAPDPTDAAEIDEPEWDVAEWDVNLWTGPNQTFNDWRDTQGIGYAAAMAMTLKAKDQVSWASTDWVFQIQKGTAL